VSPIGPAAAAAIGMHETLTAYMDAGFTRGEAMQIVLVVLTEGLRQGGTS